MARNKAPGMLRVLKTSEVFHCAALCNDLIRTGLRRAYSGVLSR